ncbi:MAG: endonuclease III [Prevotella sp.]|nr:endonuclease III [Prevotella sp.]
MTRKERYEYIIDYFRHQMPEVTTELEFGNAFQLLCATLLSAQCTDKRINQVTPALFQRFPTAEEMAKVEPEDVLEYVKSVSYPNSKSRHLVDMARMIVSDFGGKVPDNLDDLVKLPGVGRKTANVLQAVWFGKSTMAVDTHVFRVSHRLGLVPRTATTPYKVEQYLVRYIPETEIPKAHHWLLLHGRYVCTSRNPKCGKCEFAGICPKIIEGSKLE